MDTSSWSSVARLAISVIERSSSISAELSIGGLSAEESKERLAISSPINISDHIHNLCYTYVIFCIYELGNWHPRTRIDRKRI
ncbi:MAG TPA: hypothetical protein VE818_07940 [Nitrososphaeraceae archaeon]|nr:hypothetical protein [Nitrososphaeraceae archaeon]